LTENRFNDIASSAMFQVHEGCFSPPLSEFKHTKMRNGAMAHLKNACVPPVGNHWFITSSRHLQTVSLRSRRRITPSACLVMAQTTLFLKDSGAPPGDPLTLNEW